MLQETTIDVPKEVLARLDALAAKVGTTVDHLWPALVKHAQADAVTALCCGAALLLLGMTSIGLAFSKQMEKHGEAAPACFFIGLVMSVFGGVIAAAHVADAIVPEAAALASLLNKMSR